MGSPLIMLVPEQATFQIEQALAATPQLEGFIRAHVFSFQRLAYHVSWELGGAAKPRISELGRLLALRKILRASKKDLTVLGKAAERKGFPQKLAAVMAEFKMYRIAPWDLDGSAQYFEAAAQSVPLQDKLRDLSILYRAWEDFLSGRCQDMEDCLTALAEHIPRSSFMRRATVWIDGFKGFTPQEFYVIEQMMRTADVHICLCLDAAEKAAAAQETSVFHIVWKTWQKLLRIAGESDQAVSYIELAGDPPPRFAAAPALAHLESHFFTHPCKVYAEEMQQQMELVCAANPRAEIEAVARRIRELCRTSGLRYRDIAVLLRDMSLYSELIATVFADYEIPVFLDEKRSVLHHPLAELMRSALEIVSGNWGYDAVFRYLKTDLTGLNRNDIDMLENYVLAHGIRGGRWTDGCPWEYQLHYTLEEDEEVSDTEKMLLDSMNELRTTIVGPLLDFFRAAQGRQTVATFSAALVSLLITLDIPDRLAGWSQEAAAKGDLMLARQHQQIWNKAVELLDQMVDTLGEQTMSSEEYAEILETGLETLEMGLIPPGLDQVLAASLDRSRSHNLRAAFVLGVNDGIYPARIAEDDLFSSTDRESLKAAGLELAPGREGRMLEEQFFLYTAFTRAGEFLWLSYVQADNEGKGAAPSYVIRRVKDLFPALPETSVQLEPDNSDDLQFVSHPRHTLRYLAGKLREAGTVHDLAAPWRSVYRWAVADDHYKERVRRIVAGLRHKNQDTPVDQEMIQLLYGRPLRLSVSKIESFRKCPFSYFAAFALKLKNRPIFRLEAPALGQFYHAVLKVAGEELFAGGRAWGDLSRAECIKLVDDVTGKIVPRLQSEILLSTARYQYLVRKIRKVITRTVFTLAEHDRRGCFRPQELELSFGSLGKLPPIRLYLDNGQTIEVEGRIDRVDAARTEAGIYLRVIDYKMGDERLTLPEMFYGLRLQLVTYLNAAVSLLPQSGPEPVKPGGMLYFRIQDPILNCEAAPEGTELEREIIKAMKMRGFILADAGVASLMDDKLGVDGYRTSDLIPVGFLKDGAFDGRSAVLGPEQIKLLLRHAETLLKQSGHEILQGIVDIKPYKMNGRTACTYCLYGSVCQFDELLQDNIYNNLHKVTPGFIWRTLGLQERGD